MVEQCHSFYGSRDIAPQRCDKIAKKASLPLYLYLTIYLYDNLYEMGGPEKPPSRYRINLKFFLPAVGQWRRKCASFQSSSFILTLFSKALKSPILGNRVNFVLLCWQLLRPLIAGGHSCRFATQGSAVLRTALPDYVWQCFNEVSWEGIKSGGRACQRRDSFGGQSWYLNLESKTLI